MPTARSTPTSSPLLSTSSTSTPRRSTRCTRALDEEQIEVVGADTAADEERERAWAAETEVSTDTLQLFLKDIGKVPLLTAAQEVELSKRIELGEHAAKQAMVEANLRLVVSIAKRYRNQGLPVPRPDPGGDDRPRPRRGEVRLAQGLQVLDLRDLVDPPGGRPRDRGQGADDPDAGARRREAQQDQPLRAQAPRRARARADAPSRSPIDLGLSIEEVEQIKRSAQTPVSLEKPVGDEEESEFGHFLTDESEPLPEEAAEVSLRRDALRAILDALSPRERQVLELRYGLDGRQPRTLDEVGRAFNVTRERIRQIEHQSLKKLRVLAEAASVRDVP